MSARSEWKMFHRLCRVQSESEYSLLDHNCNPRYRDEFAKYVGRLPDHLAHRASCSTKFRMGWYKRRLMWKKINAR